MLPDAVDMYDQYEAEQERIRRHRRKVAAEYDRVEYGVNLEEEAS